MAELTITTFLSLDGVMQAPGGPQEDTSDGFEFGGWMAPFRDGAIRAFIVELFARAEAFLLGRGTYEIFAGYWPQFADPDDPIARALNGLPKYVASRTLNAVAWRGSSLVRDPIAEAAAIKARHGGEVQVHGSGALARSLLEHGLVDELRLLTFPVILGRGKRLFGEASAPARFSLAEVRTAKTGAVMTRYRRTGPVAVGSYARDP